MKRRLFHIAFTFSLLATAGLFISLTHYHSDSLSCLAHADEPHYVQNENVCPVCTVVFSEPVTPDLRQPGSIEFIYTLPPYQEVILTPDLHRINTGRAPPASV